MRRPLCVVCILVVSAILVYYAIHPFKTGLPEGLEEKEVVITGKVIDKEKTSRGVRLTLSVDSLCLNMDMINGADALEEREICIGEIITVSGTLRMYENATNPGQFDLRKYYTLRGIDGYISIPEILERSVSYDVIKEWLYAARYKLAELFQNILPLQNAGIIKAMLLGLKQDMDADVKALYQLNGISHVLCISGLHIAVLGNGLYKLLKRFYLPEFVVMSICLVLMLFYGLITGMGSSVMRAIVMFSMRIIAGLLHRSYDVLSAACLAALLILAENPLYLYDSGFLLSFAAVIGIVVVAPPFIRVLPFKKLSSLYTTLFVQLTTLPLCMYFFYEIPIYSVFLNLIVIPLMTPLLYISIGGLALSLVSVPLGTVLCIPVRLIFVIYQRLCELMDKLPFNSVITGKPELYQCILFYLFLSFSVYSLPGIMKYQANHKSLKSCDKNPVRTKTLLSKRHHSKTLLPQMQLVKRFHVQMQFVKRFRVQMQFAKRFHVQMQLAKRFHVQMQLVKLVLVKLLPVILVVMGLSVLFIRVRPCTRVYFLDVGQGDCIAVITKTGNCYLIDGGSSSKKNVADNIIIPFLKSKGISKVTACFISHPDMDHVNGVEDLLRAGKGIAVEKVYMAAYFKSKMESYDKITWLEAGDKIVPYSGSSVYFQVLHPTCDYAADSDNDASLVLLYREKNVFFVLTGDLEQAGEECVEAYAGEFFHALSYVNQEAVHVLKIGHHGSKNSSSAAFLALIKPDVAIISCGKNNSYGHPHEETLERLHEEGNVIFTTAECGAIILEIDEMVRVRTMKGKEW